MTPTLRVSIEFPAFDPFLIRIGSFGIKWYALAYIVGLVLGAWYVWRLMRRHDIWPGRQAPMPANEVENLMFAMMIGVILGGRLGFVLFYELNYFLQNPQEIVMTWKGGMAFHGGFLGVVLATIIYCWRNKFRVLSIGDAIACAAPIGLLLGRLANFINAELYGRPWDGAWAMKFPHYTENGWVHSGQEVTRHPSQLYEAALEGVLLFAVLWVASRLIGALRRPGTCIGLFMLGYGMARFGVEFYREPDVYTGTNSLIVALAREGLSIGQILSLPMILTGLGFLAYARLRSRRCTNRAND